MGFAYDREKNDKLESNDSEKTYEEDVYVTLHEIENSNKDLTNKRDVRIEYEYDKVLRYIRSLEEHKKDLKKRMVSLITSISIISGAVLTYGGVTALIASKNKLMPCATLSYNEVTGYSKDIEDIKVSDGKNETYIKVYEPWNMKSEREVKVYDVSNLDDMELEEYLKLNLEEMGIDYTILIETLKDNEHTILNNEEVREVVKKVIYPDDAKTDIGLYEVIIPLFFGLLALYVVFSIVFENAGRDTFMYRFFDDIDEIKSNKWYIKSYTETINNEYDLRNMLEYSVLMTEIIKRNDELRNKFVKEVNRLKCSDPSGIMEEFKRVCSEVNTSSLSDKYNEMVKTLKYSGE